MDPVKIALAVISFCLLSDEISAAGVAFRAHVDYPAGIRPAQVCPADLNGDGKTDLAVVNNQSRDLSVFINNGDGTFAGAIIHILDAAPHSVCAADFDGDEVPDLALTAGYMETSDTRVVILRNNGDGTFAGAVNYAEGVLSMSILAADFNDDGSVDLAMVDRWFDSVVIMINSGDGTFAVPVSYGGVGTNASIYTADFDGDGKADLVVASGDLGVSTLRNNGDGTFGEVVDHGGTGTQSIFAADFDGDGRPDIAASGTGYGVGIMKNNGDGTFAAAVLYDCGLSRPSFISGADFDSDGKPDLATTETIWSGYRVSILRNIADGTFAEPIFCAVGTHPNSVCAANLDSDDRVDLAVTNWASNSVSVLINSSSCCEARVGDANNDGVYPDEVTLGDIMLMVDVKFISSDCSKLPCIAEADVNQDGGTDPTCEDHVTLGDIMYLVDFLFITGPESATLPDCL